MLLLYASVTGKAESIAQLIAEEAEKRGLELSLRCMNQSFDLLQHNYVIIVSSTTGDGEQPEQTIPFFKHLTNLSDLTHLQFAILGLGDTNYSQFCNGPKNIHSRLIRLGAKTFYEPGWADDGVGLELVVEPWISGLWDFLAKAPKIKLVPTVKPIPTAAPGLAIRHRKMDGIRGDLEDNLRYKKTQKWMEVLGGKPDPSLRDLSLPEDNVLTVPSTTSSYLKLNYVEAQADDPEGPSYHFTAKHKVNKVKLGSGIQMTKNDAIKDAFQLTMDMDEDTAQDLHLEPGDAVDIICGNPDQEVDALLDCLGVDKDYAVVPCVTGGLMPDCKRSAKIPEYLSSSTPQSLKRIFKYGVEIRSVPKKPMVRMLVDFTTDKAEKRRLEELCSRQGGSVYLSSVRGANLCLLDILLAFPSCLPPVERVLEHLPPLQARPYSIASWENLAVEKSGNRSYDIVFSLVEILQSSGRQFQRCGVSTGRFKRLFENGNVEDFYVYKRNKKSFSPPLDLNVPYIMIGAGSGVAPYRGFMQQRDHLIGDQKEVQTDKTWLVFGCRNRDKDFLYEKDWQTFKGLNRLTVCFSRDDNDGVKYVQDVLRENAALLAEKVLNQNALIFVCGDALQMAKDVQDTIVEILHQQSDLTPAGATEKVADLRVKDLYLQDIWT